MSNGTQNKIKLNLRSIIKALDKKMRQDYYPKINYVYPKIPWMYPIRLQPIRSSQLSNKSCSTPNDTIRNGLHTSLSTNSIQDIDTDRHTNMRCKQQRDIFRKPRLKFSASVDKLSWDTHLSPLDTMLQSPSIQIGTLPQTNHYHTSRVNHLKMNGISSGLLNKADKPSDHRIRKSDEISLRTPRELSPVDTPIDTPFIPTTQRIPPPSSSSRHLQLSCIRQSLPPPEPKYTDPLVGASPSFITRIGELSTLEGDTVRWERSRRARRKAKQDRDS